jgi:hypothetical protein
MVILLENPIPTVVIGVITVAVLGIILVQTGRRWTIAALCGVLAVTLVLVIMESLIVTDREEVENTLERVADALESNDLDRVLSLISPSRGQAMMADAKNRLPPWTVLEARVGSGLRIELNYLTPVPTAIATFNGRIRVREQAASGLEGLYARRFTVKLREEDGQWLLYEYADKNLIGSGP